MMQDNTRASSSPTFPAHELRAQFPALKHAENFVFFDNAAGAQVPQRVFDAVNKHLLENNVQRGGRYPQSRAVDATIARARSRVAMLLNARRPEEIAFGMNATSFIRLISLAIGDTLGTRHEIIVTDMDHEANIATWLALEKRGARFAWWKMRADGSLHLNDLRALLSDRARMVACTVASNVLGTIIDVRGVADLAHAVGAEVFLDCVHFRPHAPIDVQAFDCDYLVCSGYKIFAPHMRFMWGRYDLLQALPTFREDLVSGLETIRHYEQMLSSRLLSLLHECGAQGYGISDPERAARRVPTICFNLPGVDPAKATQVMADAGIGVRDGHLYAPRLMRHFGLDLAHGAIRISLVHYNTVEEIDRFAQVLRKLR